MAKERVQTSFFLSGELHKEVMALANKPPFGDKTEVLNHLIYEGLQARRQLPEYENRENFLLMKMIFMLRKVLETRGEEFIDEIDREFSEEFAYMKDLILSEGMDYVGERRL